VTLSTQLIVPPPPLARTTLMFHGAAPDIPITGTSDRLDIQRLSIRPMPRRCGVARSGIPRASSSSHRRPTVPTRGRAVAQCLIGLGGSSPAALENIMSACVPATEKRSGPKYRPPRPTQMRWGLKPRLNSARIWPLSTTARRGLSHPRWRFSARLRGPYIPSCSSGACPRFQRYLVRLP
jgi:hypothetical protein